MNRRASFYNLNNWASPSGLTLREASQLFEGRSHTSISKDCHFLGIGPEDGEVAFVTEDKAVLLYAFYCWRLYNPYARKRKYWRDCTPNDLLAAGIEACHETASIDIREQIMIKVAGVNAEKGIRRKYQDLLAAVLANKAKRGALVFI